MEPPPQDGELGTLPQSNDGRKTMRSAAGGVVHGESAVGVAEVIEPDLAATRGGYTREDEGDGVLRLELSLIHI